MSVTPWRSSLLGMGSWPHSGMPGAPRGPALRSTSTESAVTSRSGSSKRAIMSRMSSNTTAGPWCTSRAGVAALHLITAPLGARLPRTTARPCGGWNGASMVAMTSAAVEMPEGRLSATVLPLTVSASVCSRVSMDFITAGMPPAWNTCSTRCSPAGRTFTISGVRADNSWNRSRVSGTPARPAMARRCTIALVDPPTASIRVMALSKASAVSTCEGRTPSEARPTARAPTSSATCNRRESMAGTAAAPGSVMPSPSTIVAMGEAVPISGQCPRDGPAAASRRS